MTTTVRWRDRATKDLVRLHRFLATKNKPAAEAAISAIRAAADQLETFPQLGRIVSADGHTREWLAHFGAGAYILRYRYKGHDLLVITRIWHSREQRN